MITIGRNCTRTLAIIKLSSPTLVAVMAVFWLHWANCFPTSIPLDLRYESKCPTMWWIASMPCVNYIRANIKTLPAFVRTQWNTCQTSSRKVNSQKCASSIRIRTSRRQNTSGASLTQLCSQSTRIVCVKGYVFSFYVFILAYRSSCIHFQRISAFWNQSNGIKSELFWFFRAFSTQ